MGTDCGFVQLSTRDASRLLYPTQVVTLSREMGSRMKHPRVAVTSTHKPKAAFGVTR